MRAFNKIGFFVLVTIFFSFCFVSNSFSWGEVKKAKENLDMGFYTNAFAILDPYIKKNPTNLDANLQLGRYYLLTGNDQAAMKRFDVMLKKNTKYQKEIGQYCKEAADTEYKQSRPNCQRIFTLLTHAYTYSPHLAQNNGEKLIVYGDQFREQKQYACAEKFYRLAKHYDSENVQQIVAHRFLHLAALNYRTNALKSEAEPIVGKEFINKIFPGKKRRILFKKIFSFADAYDKKYGQINVFKPYDFDIRSGDLFEMQAQLLSGGEYRGDEIGLWRGKQFVPKWTKTSKGYHSQTIAKVNGDKYVVISLNERKDLKVTVTVSRMVTEKPNLQLLNTSK